MGIVITPAELRQCTLGGPMGEGVASSIYTLFETALNSNSRKTSSPVVKMDQ